MEKDKKQGEKIRYFDYGLLTVVIFLMGFGLVMLYSTSSYSAMDKFGNSMFYFKRQAMISFASLIGMLGVALVPQRFLAKIAFPVYIAAFFLMVLVLTPLGIEAYGARRWIRLPLGQQMQPAEVAKIAIILFIPFLICRAGKKLKYLKERLKILAWGAAAAAGVLFLTDNLSSAMIVFGMTYVLVLIVDPETVKPVIFTVGVCAVGYIGARVLGNLLVESNDFRLQRILVWVKPEKYLDEGGFQVLQGLYAIGSGGLFGKGLGNSTQKTIIPEVQNDMILSIICEELGVFGAVVVLMLFGMLLYRLLFIAQNAPTMYGSLMVMGIFSHIAIQVILNIAVVLNLIPTTGITLPFISYGGTSIMFLMAEMGLALGVSRKIRFEE